MLTRVFLSPPDSISMGIHRVARALAEHAPPSVEITDRPDLADLIVLHVIGRGSVPDTPTFSKPTALIQYCLRTTETPQPEAWVPYWAAARLVWSYYDLPAFTASLNGHTPAYRSLVGPLGVDVTFTAIPSKPAVAAPRWLVGTSGYLAADESVDAVAAAVAACGGRQFHLGPDLDLGDHVDAIMGISDRALAKLYQQCAYVSGLRRVEGFELPALEALAVGTRPIVFDAPHYRTTFGDHAEYVTEGSTDDVTRQLVTLLARPPRPVTDAERAAIAMRFDWHRIASTFWTAVLDA